MSCADRLRPWGRQLKVLTRSDADTANKIGYVMSWQRIGTPDHSISSCQHCFLFSVVHWWRRCNPSENEDEPTTCHCKSETGESFGLLTELLQAVHLCVLAFLFKPRGGKTSCHLGIYLMCFQSCQTVQRKWQRLHAMSQI